MASGGVFSGILVGTRVPPGDLWNNRGRTVGKSIAGGSPRDDGEQMMEDEMKKLKDLEEKLKGKKMTTPEDNKAIMEQLKKIMQDVAADPKLDPAATTKRMLNKKDLPENKKQVLCDLQDLYDELAD